MLLDAALVLIIALVALIGFARGVSRGLIVLTGLLLGSELALWWSDTAGEWFADLLDSAPSDTQFASALALLLLATVFAGVIPSNLFAAGSSTQRSRIGGVAVGFWTALLGIGFTVRLYQFTHEGFATPEILDESRIARFSWEHFDLLLLFSVVTIASIGLIAWILGPPMSRTYPVGIVPSTGARTPIPPAEKGTEESIVKTASMAPVVVASVIDPVSDRDFANQPFEKEAPVYQESRKDKEEPQAIESIFCPNCGMEVKPTDLYCPDCGGDLE